MPSETSDGSFQSLEVTILPTIGVDRSFLSGQPMRDMYKPPLATPASVEGGFVSVVKTMPD